MLFLNVLFKCDCLVIELISLQTYRSDTYRTLSVYKPVPRKRALRTRLVSAVCCASGLPQSLSEHQTTGINSPTNAPRAARRQRRHDYSSHFLHIPENLGLKPGSYPLCNPLAGFHNASPIFRHNDTKSNVCFAANFQRLLLLGCAFHNLCTTTTSTTPASGAPHLHTPCPSGKRRHRRHSSLRTLGRNDCLVQSPPCQRETFSEAQEKQELKM